MGLDMYLEGVVMYNTYSEGCCPIKDGLRRKKDVYELGCWRKEPDLHGFIIQTFAEGVDECREIELVAEDIQLIIEAVKEGNLPTTRGFFFGKSAKKDSDDPEERECYERFSNETIEVFNNALKFLNKTFVPEDGDFRWVIYKASW